MASIMNRLDARSREVRNRRDQFFKSGGTGPFRYDEEMANVARDEENMRRESNALGNIMRQYQQAQIAPNGLRRPTGGIEEVPRAPVAPGTRPMIGQGGNLMSRVAANRPKREYKEDPSLVALGKDEDAPEGAEWIGYRDGKKLYRLSAEVMDTPGEQAGPPDSPLLSETQRSIDAGRASLAQKYAESDARSNNAIRAIMDRNMRTQPENRESLQATGAQVQTQPSQAPALTQSAKQPVDMRFGKPGTYGATVNRFMYNTISGMQPDSPQQQAMAKNSQQLFDSIMRRIRRAGSYLGGSR